MFHHPARWAKSLVCAAFFAFTVFQTLSAADLRSIQGISDTAGAFLEVSAYRPARLLVYQDADEHLQAFMAFRVGGYVFGYSPSIGSHVCLGLRGDSALALGQGLVSTATLVSEVSRGDVLKAGFKPRPGGAYPNGCLVDSWLHYERLPADQPEANWRGIFILVGGARELIGGHAVLVYLIGPNVWIYDPLGMTARCIGPAGWQNPQVMTRLVDPNAADGGWLEADDIAWNRRHGRLLTTNRQ